MKRSFLAPLLAIFLIGCQCCKNDNTAQITKYHDDGRAKPEVSIIPMLDSTSYDIAWSLSDEFTSEIKAKLADKGNLFLPSNVDFSLSSEDCPFSSDLTWLKDKYFTSEFLVFLELVEHKDVSILKTAKNPAKIPESRKAATNLQTALRIRVIDMRKNNPKVILQEIIKDAYYMPNTIDNPDYNYITWGSDEYKSTPLSLAHSEVIDQVADRINDYVMLSISR